MVMHFNAPFTSRRADVTVNRSYSKAIVLKWPLSDYVILGYGQGLLVLEAICH
jgi:hypothetical protein